ncbi:hypothetical protein SK3146_03512 [Paenibacillus konkukensis]|uniref:Uncharacterized protein n=1 Tax=Paenibacillus konkukensis TaxID=2020716 RepID=A0ABY4RSB5_9BACL|nr:hypothetical protein SK3146_03512 [Paenibacillus konkukensis]
MDGGLEAADLGVPRCTEADRRAGCFGFNAGRLRPDVKKACETSR